MDEVVMEYEEKMEKTMNAMLSDFMAIRAGRANPHVLDKLRVDYYGSASSIEQVANVSIPEPRLLVIKPWDKSLIKPIEKAINMSDIGINPQNDGIVIRLTFPEMTEDRRKELCKDVKKKGEASKVAIRNIRRDANEVIKKMQKNSEITEDEQKDGEDKIQKLTDRFIERIDKEVDVKSKEIMTV